MLKTILAGATVVSLSLAASAHAKTYDFTFTGTTYDVANGVFTTSNTANSDGTYNITSASGTLSSTNTALQQGAFTLYPGNGAMQTTADGTEYYSNLYTPGTASFADQGAEFSGASFGLNIFNGVNAGYPSCTGDCASVYQAGGTLYNPGDIGKVTISAVPEPSVWIMMLGGIALMGAALRFGRKRNGLALAA
jgi:hypothetical protein